MFTKLIPFIALSTLIIPVPTLAVPGASWVRRQEGAQSSLTLDPAVISPGLAQDGQGNNPDPGQVRSETSTNNFINFCAKFLDQGVPLTNGAQVVDGSCNQTPMGRIISLDQAPRCKFVFPKNGDESIVENTAFTVQLKLLNMQAGNFVNAATNYYAAPQQVNDQGILIGHSHVVIESLPSLQTTEPLDPNKFTFFKGLNNPTDGNNLLSTPVAAGLPKGIYRICSINTAANHQPALVSNAQHGSLDDCSYFTVKGAGEANASASATDSVTATGSNSASATATDAASASASASTTDAAQNTGSASDSASDAAATNAPAATESASAGNGGASSDGQNAQTTSSSDAQPTATDAPAADSSTDSPAPSATESAPAQDNNGGNQGNNGGNQGNSGNNGNSGNGNNTPAPAESSPAGDNSANPSRDAPANTPAPTPDAPAPTPGAPTDTPAPGAASSQDGGNNNNSGAGGNQGGGSDTAAPTA